MPHKLECKNKRLNHPGQQRFRVKKKVLLCVPNKNLEKKTNSADAQPHSEKVETKQSQSRGRQTCTVSQPNRMDTWG